jgi:DHA1 family bicyclomycin/chloramphenicol resistance-like MFS transporter
MTRRPSTAALVILLGSLTAMGPISIDMYLPSVPSLGAALQASPAQAETTVSAFLAGMAVGQLIYGPASDRVGRRRAVLTGVVVFVLASVVCALARSIDLLILARVCQAGGACAGGVVARAVIRDRFDHGATARMLSMMALVTGLAPILAPLLGGLCLTLGGWRLNFWVMAAFGAAVGLAAFLAMQESLSEEARSHARSENALAAYFALLRQRRVVGYLLAGGFNGATLFTYISMAPTLIIQVYHVPASQFGWVFGTNAAGLVAGGQVNRLLLRNSSPDRVLSRASLASVAAAALLCLAAFAAAAGPWTVLPALFLVVASYAFMQGNTMAGALSLDPRRAGATSALAGAASFGVGALVSGLAAAFEDGTARPMAVAMLAALIASALTLRGLALPRGGAAESVV